MICGSNGRRKRREQTLPSPASRSKRSTTVFFDDLARLTNDPDHSIGEQRLLIFGHAATGRLLLVNFVDREGSIRIISAREATKNERKQYEETIL